MVCCGYVTKLDTGKGWVKLEASEVHSTSPQWESTKKGVCLKEGKTFCGRGSVVLDPTYWSTATVRRSTVVLIVVGLSW